MPIKKRDPAVTGKIVHPWLPSEPCPCGSGELFEHCCSRPDGGIYRTVTLPIPPKPATGYAKTGCYMNWTRNCSVGFSREHFISQSVLKLIGDKHVAVNGVPWLPKGETRALPINELVARRILCERHNAAMSPLDTAAGKFFSAIKSIYDDLGNNRTLSRKRQWWLVSGEELELWLLKTAFGLYHSGNVARDRKKLCDVQSINTALMQAFQGEFVSRPCGIYVMKEEDSSVYTSRLDFQPLADDRNEKMAGLRLRFFGVCLLVLTDPAILYHGTFLAGLVYRPSYILFRNRRRTHTIALTWPQNSVRNAVILKGIGAGR
jgi:hypothetical protein